MYIGQSSRTLKMKEWLTFILEYSIFPVSEKNKILDETSNCPFTITRVCIAPFVGLAVKYDLIDNAISMTLRTGFLQ